MYLLIVVADLCGLRLVDLPVDLPERPLHVPQNVPGRNKFTE